MSQTSAEAQSATVATADGKTRPRVGKFKGMELPHFESPEAHQAHVKRRLAMGARIVDERGWGIACAAGLSTRDALNDNLIWVVPRGKPLCAVRTADLVGVDLQGNVVEKGESGKPVDPEWLPLHLAVYRVRPDVCGIVTAHTPHGRAFSMSGAQLKMLSQDACAYYKTIHELPFADSVGSNIDDAKIAAALKDDGKALVLKNRGLLCCQSTIDGAVGSLIQLESLCGNQLLAEAAARGRGGEVVVIGDEEASFTYKNTGLDPHQWFKARPYFARVDRRLGTVI